MSNRKCKCMPNSTRWCWWYLSWNYIHAWFSISFKQINFIRANQMVMREEGYLASQHQVEVSSQRKEKKDSSECLSESRVPTTWTCLKGQLILLETKSWSHMDSDSTQNHGVINTPIQVRVISIVHFRSLESQDHDRTMTETRPKYTLSRQLVTRSCSIVDFVTSDDCGHQAWRDHLASWRYTYLGQANPVEQQEKLENSNGGWKSPEHEQGWL